MLVLWWTNSISGVAISHRWTQRHIVSNTTNDWEYREDMLFATQQGDVGKLRLMWRHGQKLIDFRDESNQSQTLLHYAVKIDDLQLALETVKFLG